MADEAFHEIQLNGKQLVFLFMAATVVAVVIFLCGVMVGRGVGVQVAREATALAAGQALDPTADSGVASAAAVSETASPSSQEKLTYPERLSAETTPPETLREPAEEPRLAAPVSVPPPAPAASGRTPDPAGGFTVQVAAVRERDEAETIARRLKVKGYPAYVMSPVSGAPRVFRVRVGQYKDRREAESVAGRLEREEQFKPWITR